MQRLSLQIQLEEGRLVAGIPVEEPVYCIETEHSVAETRRHWLPPGATSTDTVAVLLSLLLWLRCLVVAVVVDDLLNLVTMPVEGDLARQHLSMADFSLLRMLL